MDEDDKDKSFRLIRNDAQQRTFLENSFAEADQLAGEGRFRQAADLLETVVAADPSHLEALNHLGWIYAFRLPGRRMDEAVALLRKGKIEEATRELRNLVEDVFQGPYPEAWYELGYSLEVSGSYEEAEAAYETSYRQETDPEGIKECEEAVARVRAKRERQAKGKGPVRRLPRRRER
jgi:Flp pilus assembly protein TadD